MVPLCYIRRLGKKNDRGGGFDRGGRGGNRGRSGGFRGGDRPPHGGFNDGDFDRRGGPPRGPGGFQVRFY